MAEFLMAALVVGFLFGVVLPALVLWVLTRIMLGVLWVGYVLLSDDAGMRSAFPRYWAWTRRER